MNFTPIGPKRPIKKPLPQIIECMEGIAIVDAEDNFFEGSQIFVCTDENLPIYELLESGTYTLTDGTSFIVVDGVIDEIF